tara:strand:+ start:345 stop:494 length:150 start_codon:yes stop_codon:yes gene_type:complete
LKGTSSKHAHEQSITLDPVALTISSRKEKEEEEKEKRRKKEKKEKSRKT